MQYLDVTKLESFLVLLTNGNWETFITSPIEVLNALASLGAPNVPSDSEFTSLEAFVVQLYCRNKIPLNVSKLRWHICSNQQLDAKKLPPTREAFGQKVFRAHYTALQVISPPFTIITRSRGLWLEMGQ